MTTLKRLLNVEIPDGQGAAEKAIDVAYDKSSGKCLLVTGNAVYAADKLIEKKESIAAENLRVTNSRPTILGKALYDTDGKYLGVAEDGLISKTLTLNRLVASDQKSYRRGQIYAAGDIIIIKKETAPKKAVKKVKNSPDVKPTESAENGTKQTPSLATRPRSINRRYGDFGFLLGKTADKTIINFYGEIMIKSGERVTAKTLKQAKLSGKLIELCLHSHS